MANPHKEKIMTKKQTTILICVVAAIAVVLVAVGGYFIGTYSSSDGEMRSGGFVYETSGSTATIIRYEGDDRTITIPARIGGRRVAYVEAGFLDGTDVEEVIFSEEINMIELADRVFEDNTDIVYVSLPDSLTEIPDSAFEDCTSLERVKMPASLTTIGDSAFEGCSSLVTSGADGENVFEIPETVTNIGVEAFMDCGDLISVSIGSRLSALPNRIFYNCDSLRTVTFASDSALENIGESAFRNTHVNNVTLPSSLTYIGAYAFAENTYSSFTSINIPASVGRIGEYAFSGCTYLNTVTFGSTDDPSELYEIGEGIFKNCSRLRTISLPESVTAIPTLAFYGCVRLGTFTIGEQIASIGDGAFSNVGSQATSINFTVNAPGYMLVDLMSYVEFGDDGVGEVKEHWILTDSTGTVMYAYIGAFDPENCSKVSDPETALASHNSFDFLLDMIDIREIRSYGLAGVKGSVCIPSSVTKLGEYCFMDSEAARVYIGGANCAFEETTFDDTAAGSLEIMLLDASGSANEFLQQLIDEGRNELSVRNADSFPA